MDTPSPNTHIPNTPSPYTPSHNTASSNRECRTALRLGASASAATSEHVGICERAGALKELDTAIELTSGRGKVAVQAYSQRGLIRRYAGWLSSYFTTLAISSALITILEILVDKFYRSINSRNRTFL